MPGPAGDLSRLQVTEKVKYCFSVSVDNNIDQIFTGTFFCVCEPIFNHDNIVLTIDHTGTECFQHINLRTALSILHITKMQFSAGFYLNAGYLLCVYLFVYTREHC